MKRMRHDWTEADALTDAEIHLLMSDKSALGHKEGGRGPRNLNLKASK